MKLKEKFEETRMEFLRKSRAFEHWHQKYGQRHAEMDQERGEDAIPKKKMEENGRGMRSSPEALYPGLQLGYGSTAACHS
ncbi:hypothetical protein C1H46_023845 [Malus baccata]|uniref:Uncharacterized protein n=1 Tax=Malus baccata TaxID=106549 RepID=A0A540LWG2_MALBA|nr:hypothetical protein C1H46_023845 [Malus baccata]